MNANPAHMFFCGSIPLEHEVDVFNALAEIGGERLRRVPDGELGDRRMWVIGQYAVLAASPALRIRPVSGGRADTAHLLSDSAAAAHRQDGETTSSSTILAMPGTRRAHTGCFAR